MFGMRLKFYGLLFLMFWARSLVLCAGDTSESCENKVRMVTDEELSSKTGENESDIWLSIMGQVYDVTKGREYYGEKGSYPVFAAKDGTVPFVTGVFTPEEAKKSTDELTGPQLLALEDWRKFYEDEEKYVFVGYLEGRYYDSEGNPTEETNRVHSRISGYKTFMAQEKARKAKLKAEKQKARASSTKQ